MNRDDFLRQLELSSLPEYEPEEGGTDENGYSIFRLERTCSSYDRCSWETFKSRRMVGSPEFENFLSGLPHSVPVAGGAVVNALVGTPSDDIDLFPLSKECFYETVHRLVKPRDEAPEEWKGYRLMDDMEKIIEQPHSFRYLRFHHAERPPIQVMKIQWFKRIDSLIDSFDFTAVQLGIYHTKYSGLELWAGKTSLFDAARRDLVIHRINSVEKMDYRKEKYLKKGFRMCAREERRMKDMVEKAVSTGRKDIYDGAPNVTPTNDFAAEPRAL